MKQSKDRATGALRRDLDALGDDLGTMIAAELREIDEKERGIYPVVDTRCQRCGAAANDEMAEVWTPPGGESLLVHAVCMDEGDEIA